MHKHPDPDGFAQERMDDDGAPIAATRHHYWMGKPVDLDGPIVIWGHPELLYIERSNRPHRAPQPPRFTMKTKISLLAAALLAAVIAFSFAGCVKFGVVPGQAVSATCHLVDAGEKATLIAHANHQLNDAWLPPIKACVVASQVSCVDPLPSSIPADQYSKLLACVDAVNAARSPGSVPSQAVLDKLK